MILKLLLVIGVIATVYFLFIKKNRTLSTKKNRKPKSNKTEKTENDLMVECQNCGTFTMADDAFIRNGQYYCSKECMEA